MRAATTALSLLFLTATGTSSSAADSTTASRRSEGLPGRPTTPELRQERMKLLAQLPDSEAIVIPASGRQQAVYTIFTDASCGACGSMYEDRNNFSLQGIRVRYVLVVDNELSRKVWCARDRAAALEAAFRLPLGGTLEIQCDEALPPQFVRRATAFHLRGLPTIITDDGEALVGYGPPEETLRLLGNQWDAAKARDYRQTVEELEELWEEILKADKAEELRAAGLTELLAAANQGDVESQLDLAETYYAGDGVKKDYAESLKWYRKAAEKRDSLGQFWVGRLHERGEGVPKDDRAAVNWYRQAADQNLDMAQYALGVALYNGTGIDKDQAQAAYWFRKAALQGDADAQFNLGLQYRYGIGVERDANQAAEWMQKAAAQGHQDARQALQPAVR